MDPRVKPAGDEGWSIDPSRLLGQHDRNAVTDRISELRRARDQFLFLGVVFEWRFGQRTDQDFEQFGIDAVGGTIGHHQLQLNHRSKGPHYCNGVSPGVLLLASSISVTATRISARVFKSGASSMACFSATSYGDIIASALTNASLGAFSMPSQSALRLLALRNSLSAPSRAGRSTSSSPLRATKSSTNAR